MHQKLIEQVKKEIKRQNLMKVQVAQRMRTSRAQLDRILKGENVSIETLQNLAAVLGKSIKIELI